LRTPTRAGISGLSEKGGGLGHKFPVRVLTIRRDATSAFIARALWRVILGRQIHGRLEHLVKCVLIWLAVSLETLRQPHCIRGPRRSSSSLVGSLRRKQSAASRIWVKCARIWLAVSLDPQRQPHGIRRPSERPRWACGLPLVGPVRGGCQPLRAIVKCARILRPVSWEPQPQPHFISGPATEARISLALARPRINRRRTPRGMGAGDLTWAAVCAARAKVRT
jgi:hypothetical protein